MNRQVIVNDKMQMGYVYTLTVPQGEDFHPGFRPELTPKELLALGVREYREVFFKPYRIIYRVQDETVYVLLIADGRRDMQSLLQRRLLEE